MIYINSISNALFTTLSSDSTLVNSAISIDLHEVFNTDPNRMPWVGVYVNETQIVPKRINVTQPWRAEISLSVFVQADSMKSGQDAVDMLHRTLSPVMTAVNSNRNLSNTVLMITGMQVTPYQRDINEEQWLFTDEIQITAEVDA